MVVHELGQRCLLGVALLARGIVQHHPIGILLSADKFKTVGSDELTRRSPTGAFVAIKEGMNENDACCIARRRPSYVAPSPIEPKPLRPRNRLLQQTLIAEAVPAPVSVYGKVVEPNDILHRNPYWLATLPNFAQTY